MDVYIVWERRNYTESSIILITDNESKAKAVSGKQAPGLDYLSSIMSGEDQLIQRFYGTMKMNKLYIDKSAEEDKGTTIYC